MKIFISWSKNTREFGGILSEVLPKLFDGINVFYSPEIPAGEHWLGEIEGGLNEADFGIMCVSQQNQDQQWLNYEAGALSRQVEDRRKRLGVLCLDFDSKSDVKGPFTNFQLKMGNRKEFGELMESLNNLGPKISHETLSERVDISWPQLEAAINQLKSDKHAESVIAPETGTSEPSLKEIEEKLNELISVVRDFDAALGKVAPSQVRTPHRREDSFLADISKIYPPKAKMKLEQATQDLMVLKVDAEVSSKIEKLTQDIFQQYFGSLGGQLSVIDKNFFNNN